MNLLKYKYKAHRLVNILFYLIVFLIGFILGFTVKYINFSDLLSDILMIDTVQAYTIYEDENVVLDEDYIYNEFVNLDSNFDLSTYKNIYCYVSNDNNGTNIRCYAFSDSSLENAIFEAVGSGWMYTVTPSNGDYYVFHKISPYSNNYTSKVPDDSFNNIIFINYKSDNYPGTAYSFDVPGYEDVFSAYKTLNFNDYTIDYKLNDGSIFEDENHLDFKKICWENFDELMFSVTIDNTYDGSYNLTYPNQQEGETYVESGFYVFDNIKNLKRGTRINAMDIFDKVWLKGLSFYDLDNITNEFYLMDTEEKIILRYSNLFDSLRNYDIDRGDSYYYDNRLKLKNASYVDFTYIYNENDDYSYDIFYLNEKKENFCIYIPNQFVVTTLSINEIGSFTGDVPIHNGNSESFIDRTESLNGTDYNSLFSTINQFISSIKTTVAFINENIYAFFLSMPPLLQMFLITIITLIVIKTIIWMVIS